jgi:hypothetical protein
MRSKSAGSVGAIRRERLTASAHRLRASGRRRKTHYAASLMSAADQQIPDGTRVVLEDLIMETGR